MQRAHRAYGAVHSLIRGRTIFLLIALLGMLAVSPWLTNRYKEAALWELLFTLVMLSSVYVLGVSRRAAMIAVLLAVPTLASLWIRVFVGSPLLTQFTAILLLVFLVFTTIMVLAHVFRSATITMDTLSAAFCIYVLMGYIWAAVYVFIFVAVPSAFHFPYVQHELGPRGIGSDVPVSTLLYFSFATLTTVGYGDVIPADAVARAAAVLEALIGQFYLAVLVARLVGLHIADLRR
jgi:hypothetical protein